MIKTVRQLKDLINNRSGGDPLKAQLLFRNYFMERFLERVSVSEYSNMFILKGGMLVASLVGLDMRATMDIDTTVTSMDLTAEQAEDVIDNIIGIDLGDNITFEIEDSETIRDEFDYPGIRVYLCAYFEKSVQRFKIDISTGDVITPAAIEYDYPLMFDEGAIPLMSYNVETILAEKLQTIMARAQANTRMRDFYDVYIISENEEIDYDDLREAFYKTCESRNTEDMIPDIREIYTAIAESEAMENQWENYRRKQYYVGDLTWEEVMGVCISLADGIDSGFTQGPVLTM